MYQLYVSLGSNLGDRQANILAALQRLRARMEVVSLSGFYESAAANGAGGPAFLNVAAQIRGSLDAESFARFAADVERAVGRASHERLAARAIDIDVTVADGNARPDLSERLFDLLPLAEIAPDLLDVRTGKKLSDLAAVHADNGVRRRERSLHFLANRQEEEPDVRLSLNRVGVARVRRVVHLEIDGEPRVFNGVFSMVADLASDKAGVHMSRFSEILEETLLDVLAESEAPARIERLVERIAERVVRTQRAVRADVKLRADFGLERWTPVSGKRGVETYTLVGIAHADAMATRRAIGVEAEGMTACPCAQQMMRENSLHELADAGFTNEEAERALDALPGATHNQRGRGSVLIGVTDSRSDAVRAEDLVEIVESSMSSETYDLLKRPDEFFIVNKAHHNPKFVEDVVRGILARTLDCYRDFDDSSFLFASQVNDESIHKHDAFAEAFGTFGEFREELRGGKHVTSKTDLATWLGTRDSALLASERT
ncbi:MAG TPA: GTP cyclohydrolase MptA [Candidatus Dormibacteraeota bacterium]|nr:GTP cyclohydrolase MptA [Candidatus Dormibacteraeota bacterium]